MKYLLDTHTLLWVLFKDEKLSEKARVAIRNPDNEIYVSTITYWEISLKYSICKIELEGITPEELPEKAKEIGIKTLEVSEDEASTFYKLPKIKHKDPFDRLIIFLKGKGFERENPWLSLQLIIWQAIKRNIILISKDKKMSDYQQFGLNILWK